MALTRPDPGVKYNITSVLLVGPVIDNTATAIDGETGLQFIPSAADPDVYFIRTTNDTGGDQTCMATHPCDQLNNILPRCLTLGWNTQCNHTEVSWGLGDWSQNVNDGIYIWNTASDSNHRLYNVNDNGEFVLNLTDYREPYVNTTRMRWKLEPIKNTTFTSVAASIIDFSTTSPSSSTSRSTSPSTSAPVTGTTTSATSATTPNASTAPKSSSIPVGAIVGAVVGAVCFLLLLAAMVYVVRLRQRRRATSPETQVAFNKPELDGASRQPSELSGKPKLQPSELSGRALDSNSPMTLRELSGRALAPNSPMTLNELPDNQVTGSGDRAPTT